MKWAALLTLMIGAVLAALDFLANRWSGRFDVGEAAALTLLISIAASLIEISDRREL